MDTKQPNSDFYSSARSDSAPTVSEARHTPGPWWIDDRRPSGELQIQAHHRGPQSSYCIATVNFWESREANARLIAAAPKMLDALRDALNVMKLQRDVIEHGRFATAWQHPISVIEAAIRAATPE